MTPEGRIKAACKAEFKKRGIWYCMPMGSGYGGHGIPDFVCCYRGSFLAVEAKAPGARHRTTELQKLQIAGVKKARGVAIVVDDVTQLIEVLDEMEA